MAEIVSMPKLGFDMAEGVLVRWVGKEGETISRGAILAEIETDKATVEVESAHEGIVLQHLVQQGDVVPVNKPIAVIGSAGEVVDLAALGVSAPQAAPQAVDKVSAQASVPAQPVVAPAGTETPAVVDESLPAGVRVSPLARRMARERGIDLLKVKGSGPSGRIVKADIETYQEAAPGAQIALPRAEQIPVALGEALPDQVIPLSRLRSAIGRRMTEAKQSVPHFYISYEYDVRRLLELRKQVNALLSEEEKISVNDFVIKAVAVCLRAFPNLNASLDDAKDQIIRHGQVNVGVAVAVENGLLTVVCRSADLKSIRQVASDVRNLVKRARDGKVRPEDIEGSTFSISNLGMYGVEDFQAIINPPEAAILAVSAAREIPIVENGEVKPGFRMKATISVDHRVSDGAEAARFMQELARYLEEPLRLLI